MSDRSPLLVQLSVSRTDSKLLHELLRSALDASEKRVASHKYDRKINPVHCTLAFFTDTDLPSAIDTHYKLLVGSTVPIQIIGYVADKKCIAFLVKGPDEIKVFPADRSLHITMLLQNEAPVYSNTLIKRLSQKVKQNQKLNADEEKIFLKEAVHVSGKLEIKYK